MGLDNISADIIKLLDNDISKLTKICNNIYGTGEIPRKW